MVWEQYKRTAPVVQAFILIACAVLLWGLKEPQQFVLTAFITMEIGGIFGAFWAVRLRRKMERDSKNLSRRKN